MRCTDASAGQASQGGGLRRGLPLLLALLCAGCRNAPDAQAPAVAASANPPANASAQTGRTLPAPGQPLAGGPATSPPPHRPARNWDDYRVQAAERIVAINPGLVYGGPVPEPLLAIPVLEIELNHDGSVRRIVVLRRPGQAGDTVQLAIDAVQRAAPFGPVGHLSRPWKFSETFLFNNQRRFKPRSLDS